jgi:NADH dehydrogenase
MPVARATVFGGTGFLGRRIVDRLRSRDIAVRIAARHPDKNRKGGADPVELDFAQVEVRDANSVAEAIGDSEAVVNAVGLYVESGSYTFQSVHVDGARHVAKAAKECGAERLIHISGIGVDRHARSDYVHCRAQGEAAVRDAFVDATIVRPSVMFGVDDAFLNTLLKLVKRSPIIPLFGSGHTRLQPVNVDDVAEAVARLTTGPEVSGKIFELGGPDVLSYRELIRLIARRAGQRPLLIPVPYVIWHAIAAVDSLLPHPPLTAGQIDLIKEDNVVYGRHEGFNDLRMSPSPIDAILRDLSDAGPSQS